MIRRGRSFIESVATDMSRAYHEAPVDVVFIWARDVLAHGRKPPSIASIVQTIASEYEYVTGDLLRADTEPTVEVLEMLRARPMPISEQQFILLAAARAEAAAKVAQDIKSALKGV